MKFMKLGSKPDAFHSDYESNSVRCVSSELETDFIVIVDDVHFHLHKFPLLSKSNRLQKLALTASEENSDSDVHLVDFPGGPKIFEICAKFCYGITVSISPYNVVAVRCAAEYLEMTEDIDKSNLILKTDVFFKSSILCSWKDSIIALQTTTVLPEWSEDVEITAKCVEAIATKTAIDPACVTWSYTYNRKIDAINKELPEICSVPNDWWAEDLCELDIDVYKRVMFAVISKKRVEGDLMGEALKTYCLRWLPDCNNLFESVDHVERYKSLIESIICLLTPDKGVKCSCSFLLKLLKVSVLVGVDQSLRHRLIGEISSKLDEASVRDLLIPVEHTETTVYDVELVQDLVDRFFDDKKNDLLLIDPRRYAVIGRLIDGYLAEVARDRNLPPSVFVTLSRSIPDAARPVHDGIYGAVDVYLKEHPKLTKLEKKTVCELIDVKKLSAHASIHAAQNDRLPLRTVVQILFHEQVRAAAAARAKREQEREEHDWEIKLPLRSKSLRTPSRMMDGEGKEGGSMRLMASRSRRILERFWVVGVSQRHGESKSTGTSGSSQSKSSSSSSRKHRYSIS
ncbi:hypothetical protein SSX86_004478 [Deinandra increscens subsp. villosa]|uniref:Uncharacterized protein n=1 Tax=Deinandra increscens subsp. villosa TaxID=3103831 RepID=A0AAP0DN26_9ASTR